MRTSDELSLISDEQKDALSHLGTKAGQQLQGVVQQYPSLGEHLARLPAGSMPSVRGWWTDCVPTRGI